MKFQYKIPNLSTSYSTDNVWNQSIYIFIRNLWKLKYIKVCSLDWLVAMHHSWLQKNWKTGIGQIFNSSKNCNTKKINQKNSFHSTFTEYSENKQNLKGLDLRYNKNIDR